MSKKQARQEKSSKQKIVHILSLVSATIAEAWRKMRLGKTKKEDPTGLPDTWVSGASLGAASEIARAYDVPDPPTSERDSGGDE